MAFSSRSLRKQRLGILYPEKTVGKKYIIQKKNGDMRFTGLRLGGKKHFDEVGFSWGINMCKSPPGGRRARKRVRFSPKRFRDH